MIVSEIEISYKTRFKINDSPSITNSRIIYQVFLPYFEKDMDFREMFYIALINRTSKVKGIVEIGKGGIHSVVTDIRIILATALKTLSTGIILAHNHPSQCLKASQEDIKMTKTLIRACKYMDLRMFDHIILAGNSYSSMIDEGII